MKKLFIIVLILLSSNIFAGRDDHGGERGRGRGNMGRGRGNMNRGRDRNRNNQNDQNIFGDAFNNFQWTQDQQGWSDEQKRRWWRKHRHEHEHDHDHDGDGGDQADI